MHECTAPRLAVITFLIEVEAREAFGSEAAFRCACSATRAVRAAASCTPVLLFYCVACFVLLFYFKYMYRVWRPFRRCTHRWKLVFCRRCPGFEWSNPRLVRERQFGHKSPYALLLLPLLQLLVLLLLPQLLLLRRRVC